MAFDNPSGLPELTGIDTEMDDEDKDKENKKTIQTMNKTLKKARGQHQTK